MASTIGGWLSCNTYNLCKNYGICSLLHVRNYAARKGTREKARRAKAKRVVKEVEVIPITQRGKKPDKRALMKELEKLQIRDVGKPKAVDNVYPMRYFSWKSYSFAEAVQCHRETHHPTVMNIPNEYVTAVIELDMHGVKKTKLADEFSRIAEIPHKFERTQKPTLMAFCKCPETKAEAEAAGATLVGGIDIIKQIQKGEVSLSDFDHVVAYPDILPELVAIKGLLKKKFPANSKGTLSNDMKSMIYKFLHGIPYSAKKNAFYPEYGRVDVAFGKLEMETSDLEENFAAVLKDINSARPKREGPFITRTRIGTLSASESFKVEFAPYIATKNEAPKKDEEEEEEEEEDTSAAVRSNI
ncbi:uncharacterized protein LOC105704356 [Orussus abietinus]|uniref:uncharacterized protein LOC105704356 n=1 Tax=Orussus abietinus TaxID=222816 RepID=UPI000625295E|nr:uncharacterized protein LOC105704356 [Orussus abietinus]